MHPDGQVWLPPCECLAHDVLCFERLMGNQQHVVHGGIRQLLLQHVHQVLVLPVLDREVEFGPNALD